MLPRIIRYFRCNTYILLTTFQQVYSFMWLYSALYPFWGQKPKRNKRMIPKLLWRISISQASIHFSSLKVFPSPCKKHKSSHICSWDGSMTFTVKNGGICSTVIIAKYSRVGYKDSKRGQLMFMNCSVFCDVWHVWSSVLGQNAMFRSVRSSVF